MLFTLFATVFNKPFYSSVDSQTIVHLQISREADSLQKMAEEATAEAQRMFMIMREPISIRVTQGRQLLCTISAPGKYFKRSCQVCVKIAARYRLTFWDDNCDHVFWEMCPDCFKNGCLDIHESVRVRDFNKHPHTIFDLETGRQLHPITLQPVVGHFIALGALGLNFFLN